MRTRMGKFLKRTGIVLAVLFVLLSIVPYFIPDSGREVFSQEGPFPESRFEEIDGTRIHYRIWKPQGGQGRGKILLVHGLGGSTFSWQENVDALVKAGYLVAAVDLPGFGYSTRRSGVDHSQQNRSKLLWKLLDGLQGEVKDPLLAKAPWHLAGHSMGGGTVAAMGIERPQDTASVILVDGALFFHTSTFMRLLLSYPPAARWAEVILKNMVVTPERVQGFLASAYGQAPSTEAVQGYLAPLEVPGTGRIFADLVKSSTAVSLEDLKDKKFPLLLLWGDQDGWVPLEEAYRIKEEIPRAELRLFSGAAHCPMETHSEEFNKVILEFLEQ